VEALRPHAIQIRQTGGPEVLNWTPIEAGEPGSGQVRLRQAAAGLNYIDVYNRTGYYSQPLPFIPGLGGAGTVEAIGQEVRDLKVGDRVAYAGPAGGYSEVRLIKANRLVRLPDAISFDQAAAMMLQGMTAQAPIRQVYPVKAGDLILVHAAAGGTGLILFLWAAALAATVIGAVSTEAKAERREELEASTNELFNVVAPGKVRINVNQRFALKDAADAHKALEARATSGSTVLIIEPTVHRSFP
jgi:NADPH2:quinone reductase